MLLVEDHTLLAQLTVELLMKIGCSVLGPAASLDQARAILADSEPAAALVDLELPDGMGTSFIPELVAKGVACSILSGYDKSDVIQSDDVPWIRKPVDEAGLMSFLEHVKTS
ncbi:MAG: response regulator [Phycisphaerales bacterium]